ncbi:MAG: ComEC/Rec2 family competence protein [bacterium]
MFSFVIERVYLQVLLLFSLGIALGGQLGMPAGMPGLAFWPALVLLGCLLGLHWLWHASGNWLARLPAALALCLCGYLYCGIAVQQVTRAPLNAVAGEEDIACTATVRSLPKYQRGHLRFIAEFSRAGELERSAGLGRCQIYLQCEPDYLLSPGDRFSFHGLLEEVENPRNRGQFNYRAYLLQRGTLLSCYIPSERFLRIEDDSGSQRLAWLTRLRGRLTASLTAGLPESRRDLAVSVVYGDKITDLDEELQERFRRAGLTHILVASGTQVSLLIVLMAMMLWRSPRGFDARGTWISLLQFLVTISVVAIYAGITGYETSIVRALCMGILLCAGRLFLRRVDGLSTLSQAGLILLLTQPLQLFTPGFQLSFLATFGLIYLMGILSPYAVGLNGWRRFLTDGLLTTGGAQLFVTPVLAASFHQFSLVGLLSNLLAVPLSLVLLVCGALSSFGLSALPGVGNLLNWLVGSIAGLLDGLAAFFAGLPFSSIAVPAPPGIVIAAFYLLVLLAGEWLRNRERISLRQLAVLQPACLLLGWICAGWVAGRLLLPSPELAVLRLERSFAVYHDNPVEGRCLLASSYWLSRRHNADNLLSALKARGVNRLDRVYWIDDIPDDNPLQSLSPEQLLLESAEDAPFELLAGADGDTAGISCSLGSGSAAVLWDSQAASCELDAGVVVLVASQGWEPGAENIGELEQAQVWLSVDAEGEAAIAGIRESSAEISMKPAPWDRLLSFRLLR